MMRVVVLAPIVKRVQSTLSVASHICMYMYDASALMSDQQFPSIHVSLCILLSPVLKME